MARRDKTAIRALAQQKKHRRKWLTFFRMCRYGLSNFTRNLWLTVAATAVMTITLVIILVTIASQHVLSNTALTVGKRIERSIYLKTGTTREQARPIITRLENLSNTESVTFISSEEARAEFAKSNTSDANALDALTQATNRLPSTVRIGLRDINDTSQIVEFVETDETLKEYIDPVRKPTFIGERRLATDTIASWTGFAQNVGIIASVLFVSISSLIIFNTIRMAIFNRRDEIEMMKLIGADKSFIRGPFVVEAIVYGLIAALIATAVGLALLFGSSKTLQDYGVTVQPTTDIVTVYMPFVLLSMMALGAIIGTISSLLATRRYLKI